MSESKKILVKDFGLFVEVMKSTQKIVEAAKLLIDENGMQIYGSHARTARCEIESNSISCTEPVDFCVADLAMFVKVLSTIKDIHGDDYTDFEFLLEKPFVRFKSKKFKTKFVTCNEDVIEKVVSERVKTAMEPVFEFTTTTDLIKRINSHSFIFQDPAAVRIYIDTKKDMENNAVFATIGNKETDLNNEMTLKLGLVTSGKTDPERPIIVDLDRLNLFAAYPTDALKISLMNKNVLVSKLCAAGKNDSFFRLDIYNSLLK